MNLLLVLSAYLLFGGVLVVGAYVFDVYPLEQAVGYLSRAQSAAYAEDMASYVSRALPLLPKEGNPVWIFPTERTDYALIRKDLESIAERLQTIAPVPRENPAYPQTLNDLRGKIAVLINQIYETMPYMIFKPTNLAAAIIYVIAPFLIRKVSSKHVRRRTHESMPQHS